MAVLGSCLHRIRDSLHIIAQGFGFTRDFLKEWNNRTEQGQTLQLSAQIAFDNLEKDIHRLRGHNTDRITIGMATYFASRWLSPRLMHFITAHPEIGLCIQPLVDLMDLAANELDLAVRWGKGEWPQAGYSVELIFKCPAMLTASFDSCK